ncbi:unnamed protein product [Ectocarpus sp. 6 AP-2014]
MSSGVRPVQLNVYDLHESNSWLQHIGLGAYHSGLEIGGVEYTFSEAGVAQHPPRQIAGDDVSFKTTEVLGDFIGTIPDVRRILNGLKSEGFAEGEYDVIRNNCNHFCDEFAFALTGKRIPPWVNRAATIGTWAGLGEVCGRLGRVCSRLCVSCVSASADAEHNGHGACGILVAENNSEALSLGVAWEKTLQHWRGGEEAGRLCYPPTSLGPTHRLVNCCWSLDGAHRPFFAPPSHPRPVSVS